MNNNSQPITLLIADDDEEDRLFCQEALVEAKLANDVRYVEDGEDLLNYLYQRNPYNSENSPRPGMIFLDLNMPKMDGREALEVIKADESLRKIPIIVLTTSSAEEDILRSYDTGASSYITKPVTFDGLVKVMISLKNYWFEIVELPTAR